MRSWSPVIASATVVGVAVLGFVPTSAGLSNGVGALECRAVLAPVEQAYLTDSPTDQQRSVQQAWFVANGYIDDVRATATNAQEAEAAEQIRALCGEAQRTRSVWMVLTAVFGLALAFVARRAPLRPTDKDVTHG